MGVWYATRETVKAALDSAETARNNAQVDRALEAASRGVEKLCRRKNFYPVTATRYFDWPDTRRSRPWRLWLDGDELVSVTLLTAAGKVIAPGDYFLEPANDGPPFSNVQINLASQAAFAAGATHQRAIAIAGVYGYGADETPAGQVAEVLDGSETDVDVSNSAAVGVGDLVRVDDERMLVTGKSMLSTGQTLQAPIGTSTAETAVAVTSGAAYAVDEVILLDTERMLVVDIAGNTLIVKRAWDGTVLASHTTPTIYAPRTLRVQRAAAGTTAAGHSTAAPLMVYSPPGPVRDLAIAEAMNSLLQQGSGYSRTVRSGESQSDAGGAGLEDLRSRVKKAYGRSPRMGSV